MIISDSINIVRSRHRIAAICQSISELLAVAPQLSHLSVLAKLTNWNTPTLENALNRAGIVGVQGPTPGKRVQVDTLILNHLLSLDPEGLIEVVNRIKALQEVADMSNPLMVETEEAQTAQEQTPEVPETDLI